jgi:aminoglycoside phosphotransferase
VPISDVEFQSIWGTRSGCRIGKVGDRRRESEGKEQSDGVIFKEGNRRKILQEKENIERWEALMPGLPPRVLAHQQEGNQASLLIEFLGGCTYQDVVLTADTEILENATFLVEQTVHSVWESTKAYGPVRPRSMEQLKARIWDVMRLHPSLKREARHVGDLELPALEGMIAKAQALQEELSAPYTVFVHGDFNINNIVYDHANQQIHYIDLHRSKQADPLQDVAVFMVSNYRLPLFEPFMRHRLTWVAQQMLHFAREYAQENKDPTFDARLALGLVRNFITSTRFELNPGFARDMFLRGVYVLERVLAHGDKGLPYAEFRIPEDVLVY